MKPSFSRLTLATAGDGIYFTTKRLFWTDKKTGIRIKVPSGFRTDLASVPRPMWSILPPFGKHSRAAIIHDYLYRTNGLAGKLTRAQCDRIFYQIMRHNRVAIHRAWLMWLGVRIGGWLPWLIHNLDR